MDKEQLIALSTKTFNEYFKGKVLSIVIVLSLILILVTYVSVQFTYGIPERVCVDVSLGITSLLLNGLSIFLGANLIRQEIETRTIYTILSCSCSRSTFLLGKIIGLALTQVVSWLVLLMVSLILLWTVSGLIPPLFVSAFVMIFFEASLLLMLSILLGFFYEPILTTFLTIMIYLGGYGLDSTLSLSNVQNNEVLATVLKILKWIIPNFSLFDLKPLVLYQVEVPMIQKIYITGYYALVSLLLFLASKQRFQKMDIQ